MGGPRSAVLSILVLVAGVAGGLPIQTPAFAQTQDDFLERLRDRPIGEVRIEGLQRVAEQLVRNQLRATVGNPFDPEVLRGDLRRLERLGDFRFITPTATPADDGTVIVSYTLVEQPIIGAVQVAGNDLLSDQDLLSVVRIRAGVPRDEHSIEMSKRAIEDRYRERGHYLTTVTLDESQLETSGVLLFRVIEGPRLKVKAIEFDGNDAFPGSQLRAEIKTRTHIPFLRAGVLDEEVLEADLAALDEFYRDRGYIDVQVDKVIDISPDYREAKVTYLLDEGRQYTLEGVEVERHPLEGGGALRVLAPEQIAAMLEIKPGDVYSHDLIRKSVLEVEETYGRMGYLDARVDFRAEHRSERPEVNLRLIVFEGQPSKVGLVLISGHPITRDKVIRRLIRLRPGRPYDATEIEEARRRIGRTQLFTDPRITVQQPDPDAPEYRDVLVEVKERNTGAINFGVAVGSDSGFFGDISLTQRNFDIADTPESLSEMVRGAAFRGAGQRFSMNLRPGNELFLYSMSLTEPHLFESDYALTLTGNYRQRVFDEYDEERLSGLVQVSRRLGDVWQAGIRTRFDNVELTDINPDAPTDVFEDAGPDNLTQLGFSLTRTTLGTITRPGRGSRLELSWDQAGALGGDFDYSKLEVDYTVFFTLDEDFLGRRSILRLNGRVGHIFGGRAPTYERFYLGGRSFRGLEFRTVSPKGIRADTGGPSDEPVGGDWLVFLGAQYEFPIFQETITGVLFADSGTVTTDPGFDDYRLSVGMGVRLYIPQLGPVPIAFDFGIPIVSESSDEEEVLSFAAELPWG